MPEQLQKMDSTVRKALGSWTDEFCAEHDGSIFGFDNLSLRLEDIDEYSKLFERKSINVVRAAKFAGYSTAGALAFAGVVVTGGSAAPVAAAIGKLGLLGAAGTGTAISSLTGAALTSASLAAIGGSVATGTVIITAVGAGLGGIQGGVIAGKYHSDDKSFKIRKLNEVSTPHRTIFINGFTEEKNETFHEWSVQQLSIEGKQQLYGVNWASKTQLALGAAFAGGTGSKGSVKLLKDIAKVGGKKAAKGLNPVLFLDLLADLIGNTWHTAMIRASQAGVQLAEALSRTEGKTYTLVGHSLGCRVIYYALEALATKSERYVSNVVFLGGAVGRNDAAGWTRAASAVSGKIINCYSGRDSILELLYQTANARFSEPIGFRPISLIHPKISNIDCSDIVSGHLEWKPAYTSIIKRVRAG